MPSGLREGFLVVRMPPFNYCVKERDVVPHLNDLYYSGVDRQQWIDVFDEDFYSGSAPAEIKRFKSTLPNDFTNLNICPDLSLAARMLTYSNRRAPINELIAVMSPPPTAPCRVAESVLNVEWLGYDFVSIREWSLIAGGVFFYPDYYSNWLPRLNQYGLFDDPDLLEPYMITYQQACEVEQSEPLAPGSPPAHIEALRVGRVRLPANYDA